MFLFDPRRPVAADQLYGSRQVFALMTQALAREEAGKPLAAAVASLQEESDRLQKQLEGLRQEQKKVSAELDRQIAALNSDLAQNAEKTREAESRQKLHFKNLGEKLAAAQGVAPDIAREMARKGAPHFSVVIAGRQTRGRGRLRREASSQAAAQAASRAMRMSRA